MDYNALTSLDETQTLENYGFVKTIKFSEKFYLDFLKKVVYDAELANKQVNLPFYAKSMKVFEAEQTKKFESAHTVANKFAGCCLNFATYLAKKLNGMILTCIDNNAIHCACIYLSKNNEVMVADPAWDKAETGAPKHFNIKLEDYLFKNDISQQGYKIVDAINSNGSVVQTILQQKGVKTFNLPLKNTKELKTELLNKQSKILKLHK